MMKINKQVLMLCMLVAGAFISKCVSAQTNDSVIFNPLGNYNFNLLYSGYTPLIDRLNRPYVYLATKELGVVTFDISNTFSPVPVDTISKATLNNLKASAVAQDSNFLFISLGDFEGAGENAGLAIFNISNPASPVIVDKWDSAAFNKGTSSVIVDGDYAYLSAMAQGVLILDISDKQNIQFVSQIIPDTVFGFHHGIYHARGLFLSNDTLLVAYDNGGLRMIDLNNKQFPLEIGMYVNHDIDSIGRAYYNHIYRIGNTAFCAVDFCGFEVVDVSTASNIQNISWLNPWNCTNLPFPFGSWLGSDGHTNEISYDAQHNILFFSGGDSQVLAFDPSNPAQPKIIGTFGLPDDSVGSWGIDAFNNLIAIANIHTLGFPFVSVVGGLQLLNYQVITALPHNEFTDHINVFPNPVTDKLSLILPKNELTSNGSSIDIRIYNAWAKEVKALHVQAENFVADVSEFPTGVYFVKIMLKEKMLVSKFIKL
jgi:hypothetical protein